MKLGDFFTDKVRLPIWPLIPLVILGIAFTPHSHVYWGDIAQKYAVAGLMVVSIRYWWAWIHGAPWFDWLILMALCVSMGALANVFVSTVVRIALQSSYE